MGREDALPPQCNPEASTARPHAHPHPRRGQDSEVSGCSERSIGRRPRMAQLREPHIPAAGVGAPPPPPPPQVSAGRGLTLHQQQDAPQQHGRASGKREEGCRLAAGLLALGERERGSGDAGGPGEVQRQSASRELPTLQSEPSGNETPACRARCAELQRRVRPSWSPATAGLGREETTAGTLLKGQWLLGEREVGSQCLRPGF
jgi:hypothetical protein